MSQIEYAMKTAKQLSVGEKRREFKVRTGTCKFVNKKTQKTAKKAQYIKKIADRKLFNQYDIIRYPVRTEKCQKLIDEKNTLVFIVKLEATKPQIKAAFKEIYGFDVEKVNTLITPLGEKKAFLRIKEEGKAVEIANTFEAKE